MPDKFMKWRDLPDGTDVAALSAAQARVSLMPTIDHIRDKALSTACLLADIREAGRSNTTDDAALIGVFIAELLGVDPTAVRDAVKATRPAAITPIM